MVGRPHRSPSSELDEYLPRGAAVPPFMTVVELLDQPPLQGARLRAAATAASARQIRRTSVQEVPVQDFVREDELVMTTGIGLGADPGALTQFVESVAEAGAAGLAVAIGYHVDELPRAVVDWSETHCFPLVELPWGLRFSEVAEIVLDRAIEHQHALLRQSEQLHELFTQIVLGGGSMDELCGSVRALTGLPVSIQNRWGEHLGTATDDDLEGSPQAASPARAMDVPILAGSRDLGSLHVSASEPVSDSANAVLRHAATAAALMLMIDEANDEARARDASEFVSAVISRWTDSRLELEHWARRLGIDPTGPLLVALGTFQWPGDSWDERGSAAARWALERALSSRRTKALAMWQGPDVTLVIPPASIASDERVRILADDVRTLVQRHERRARVTWGIGRLANGLGDVAERYHDARIANRLGSAVDGRDVITTYQQLGAVPALFEAVSQGPVSSAFLQLEERYLGPVLECEQRTGLELTKTLQTYFASNGNVSAAARSLGLNRQSMIYRIAKIEALTGIDLDQAGPRFALELALRARKIRSGEPDGDGSSTRAPGDGSRR